MMTRERIIDLVEKHIGGTDIFLVDVVVKQGNTIRVHVDTPGGISIEECAGISRFLNESLDRDMEDFSLEVSSPGLGTPFRVRQQYLKNVGHRIEVRNREGVLLTGELASVSDEGIVLKVKGSEKVISYQEIKTAKEIVSFN